MYSLVDMAIYPVLFNQYLTYFFPGLPDGTQWVISLAIIGGRRGSIFWARAT